MNYEYRNIADLLGLTNTRPSSVSKRIASLGRYGDFFEACCTRKSAENRYYERTV